MQPVPAASIVAKRFSRLAPEREYPDHATLRHGIRIELYRCLSHPECAGIDAPSGLDSDILCVADLVGDRHADDARVGALLPEEFSGLGAERTEPPRNARSPDGRLPADGVEKVGCWRGLNREEFRAPRGVRKSPRNEPAGRRERR
jgi:hypothetical protein